MCGPQSLLLWTAQPVEDERNAAKRETEALAAEALCRHVLLAAHLERGNCEAERE